MFLLTRSVFLLLADALSVFLLFWSEVVLNMWFCCFGVGWRSLGYCFRVVNSKGYESDYDCVILFKVNPYHW